MSTGLIVHTVEEIQIGERLFRLPYADLLPPLSADEYAELRQDIAARGIVVPVVVDERNNIIDGQHRVRIAEELGFTDVPTTLREGLDVTQTLALAWDLNAHRRHMTKELRQEWAVRLRQRGLSYRQIGERLGIDPMTARSDVKAATVENSTVPDLPIRIIGRDGKDRPAVMPKPHYVAGEYDQTPPNADPPAIHIDTDGEVHPSSNGNGHQPTDLDSLRESVWEGTPRTYFQLGNVAFCLGCNEAHVQWGYENHAGFNTWRCGKCGRRVADAEMITADSAVSQLAVLAPATHQLINASTSNEWYTPAPYVEAARTLMGGIDLDPASCDFANQVVQASTFFTIDDDGLQYDWFGRVWLNPPYGWQQNESNQAIWSARLIEEYESHRVDQAVLLVNAVPEREWFQPLWDYAICFVTPRIRFYNETINRSDPTHGSVLVYFGENTKLFTELFGAFGRIVVPQGMEWGHSVCLRRS